MSASVRSSPGLAQDADEDMQNRSHCTSANCRNEICIARKNRSDSVAMPANRSSHRLEGAIASITTNLVIDAIRRGVLRRRPAPEPQPQSRATPSPTPRTPAHKGRQQRSSNGRTKEEDPTIEDRSRTPRNSSAYEHNECRVGAFHNLAPRRGGVERVFELSREAAE
jgi:hypothetical protein